MVQCYVYSRHVHCMSYIPQGSKGFVCVSEAILSLITTVNLIIKKWSSVMCSQRRRKREGEEGRRPPNMKSGGGRKYVFAPPIIVHIYNTSILNGWLYLK